MNRIISSILNLHFRFAFFRHFVWGILVLVTFSISAALIFQNRSVVTYPVGWEKSLQISSFNIVARDLSVASRGNTIAVVYDGLAGGAQGIYLSLSLDGGASFMPHVRVAGMASRISMSPHAAISPSGAITVMWHAYVDNESSNRIYYSTSSDLGASWTVQKKMSLDMDMEMLPRVYYDDRSNLHLFYHGSTNDNISLYHAISKDGLKFDTTGPLVKLTGSMRGAFFPSINISGRYFFLVWQGKEEDFSDELFFMKSSDYGKSWSYKKQITSSTGNNAAPQIMLVDNTLYVAYQNNDEKNWGIKMLRGIDRGWDWERTPVPASTTLANCYAPAIGVTGGDIMIFWYDTRDGRARIYARKYSIREKKFLPEVEVSEARYESRNPVVVSLGKRLMVFWEERNIVMSKQTDVYVEPPAVYSDTNPEGRWSRVPYVIMQWRPQRDDSGIAGYAAVYNKIPDFNPSVVNLKPGDTMQKITEDINDGVSYFHIRAVDGAGNFSRTVHYKLQLAVNPLPGPVIVSPTHIQGKPTAANAPAFAWAIDEPERVKGFIYSLSQGTIGMPDQFTTDLKAAFSDLADGVYFFSVAAIDKTNQLSRLSTYDFIIGAPDRVVDPEYYKQIADQEKKFQKYYETHKRIEEQKRQVIIAGAPSVWIQFPFNPRASFDKNSFKAIIMTSGLRRESIQGYSVYIDGKRRAPADHLNQKGPIMNVSGLRNGEYYIGVKCRYTTTVGGAVRSYWTKPYIAKIAVVLPADQSPVVHYARNVLDKFPRRFGLITITFFGLGLMITTLGFGSRLTFYFRLMLFRMNNRYRLLRKRMSG